MVLQEQGGMRLLGFRHQEMKQGYLRKVLVLQLKPQLLLVVMLQGSWQLWEKQLGIWMVQMQMILVRKRGP
ncbi:hypothetical protein AQUCO_01100379v1 [Aquilegia coerulea]|uniref:Uncharacterized protein n=1 Tax=Aquilegia coerulea TaxID=218851 RepID=A0A2G5E6W2_AQUCA|nr:hypothetical protein AQUCO_01100379v1 [Aquilegia coerulea]